MSDTRNNIHQLFQSKEYTLLEKIGEGGFGEVYKAKKISTKQLVAIKFLKLSPDTGNHHRNDQKNSRHIDRFHREVLLASQLQHPNIIRLLDKGECYEKNNPEKTQVPQAALPPSLVYAVFEYIEGQSLKEYLAEHEKMTAAETVQVMSQVLDALAHAHNNGIIHRDIKPANIMLVSTGAKRHVKILDFGISALLQEMHPVDYRRITLTQETLGTPSYSAPEQLRGEPPSAGTDLYVWGLVFIECLTGNAAISGSTVAAIFHRQLSPANIPLPATIVGHPIANLLSRVLQKKSAERADNAEKIYHELMRINTANILPVSNNNTPLMSLVNNDVTYIDDATHSYTELTERKQITVLCAIISPRLLDSNHTHHDVIDALHRDQKLQCSDIAIRYGALHVGTLGDTLLFYFGYPVVSENDGRLAARTALDIASHINQRNALLIPSQQLSFDVRMGIHSGVFTAYADTIPDGETANIAMALARQANAQTIICSNTHKKIVEHHIVFDPIASKTPATSVSHHNTRASKSNAPNSNSVHWQAALPIHHLTAERKVEAFGFLRYNQRSHYFVGRQEELDTLRGLLTINQPHVRSTSPVQLVHIHGEAGIGKSRLLAELRQQTPTIDYVVVQCLPEYQHNALLPILNMVRHRYALASHTPSGAADYLRMVIQQQTHLEDTQVLPVLCTWLYLPIPDDMVLEALSPQQQKQRLFDVIAALLLTATESRHHKPQSKSEHGAGHPHQWVFIIEDLHWADPVSIEFVDSIAKRANHQQSHLILTTSRNTLPEALQDRQGRTLAMNKLDNEQTTVFIHQLFDNHHISDNVLNEILHRTDGIPLFIEEMVTMLKQKQWVHHLNGTIDFVNPDKLSDIPNSLRDSLQQNLDNLKGAKETIQLAATIGREFSYALLVASAEQSEEKLQTDINELLEAELIYVQRKVDGDHYIFKHALVKDVAYDSILNTQQQTLHHKIAEALEHNEQPNNAGLLAMHWAAAKHYPKAIEYGQMSASQALERSSASEAIVYGEKVKQWATHLSPELQLEPTLAIYGTLTSAYMETKGWGSEEVLHYSNESLKLLKENHKHDDLVSHLWWKTLNGIVSGRRSNLAAISAEMEPLLDHVNTMNQAAIKCAQGFYYFTDGNRPACITVLQESITLYYQDHQHQEDERKNHQAIYGFDVGVFAKATIARAYADQTQDEYALHYAQQALDEAKAYEHIPSIGIALMYHGLVHQHYHNKTIVKQSSSELIRLSEQYRLPIYQAFGQMLFDWSIDDTHRADRLLQTLSEAGSRHGLAHFQSFYAQTYAAQGHYAEARKKIEQCLALDRQIKEGNYEAYLLCRLGQYLLMDVTADQQYAYAYLEQADTLATAQGTSYINQAVHSLLEQYPRQDTPSDQPKDIVPNDTNNSTKSSIHNKTNRSTKHTKKQQEKSSTLQYDND